MKAIKLSILLSLLLPIGAAVAQDGWGTGGKKPKAAPVKPTVVTVVLPPNKVK